jgi:hypothetical protein
MFNPTRPTMGIGKHLSDAEFEEFNQITYKISIPLLLCFSLATTLFVIFSGIQVVVPKSLHIIALHHNYFMFMTFTHSAGIFLNSSSICGQLSVSCNCQAYSRILPFCSSVVLWIHVKNRCIKVQKSMLILGIHTSC